MANLDPLPQAEPLVLDSQQHPLYMSGRWLTWFYNAITNRTNAASYRLGTVVQKTGLTAAITATALPLPTLSAGRVRVSWYVRVTTADGVSSAVQVTIGWTESTTTQTVSGKNLTGDTVTTLETGTAFIEIDGNSSITYATTYSSNTPAKMTYRLSVEVEALP